MTPEYNLMRGTAYFIALASTAFAQEQEQEQESPLFLGRIVLTTDRVGEQLLDVPANITVIDGETISDRQITDIEELTRRLPGVNVFRQVSGTDPFSSFSGFTIRGVGGNRVAI
ncbi:MAG: Plug domain-containing protein, partial [Pseudomonadota bacterium]